MLSGQDVLVGCIAENDPRLLDQALRLVQSIRWFGGELAEARVRVCVASGLDRGFRRAFERLEAEVRTVSPPGRSHRVVNRHQLFPDAWESDREMLLLLDCDTVVMRDPLPWMHRGALQAKIAPLPTVTPEVFERVFRHYGLPLPPRAHVNSCTGTPTIPYCNSGVIVLPSALAREVLPVWRDYGARLTGEIGILHPCERQSNQAALSLALAASAVPFKEAPAELNFQLNFPDLPPPEGFFAIDPAILHYHGLTDSEGYLSHSSHPFSQVRIEAFNRRLRQDREGRPAAPKRERPAPPAAPGAQVVVLGMHRSGTSALTALLQLMGLWAGDEGDFPPADEHNQEGYWEHRGIWSVDEAILRTLGASWSEALALDLSRLEDGLLARFRERARAVVRDLDAHGSWVVKDPRLCVLFPFWREVLERPVGVLLYREPLPVARSLAARDGFPIPFGIALWELYTREALASTRGLPRVLISHEELMADPLAVLQRVHRDLGIAGLRLPSAGEVRAVVNPDLVHHPRDPEAERAWLTPPQAGLLEALRDGGALALDPVPPLSVGSRELLASWQGMQATTRSLRERFAAEIHAAEVTSREADLRRALSWLDELDAIVSSILESHSWRIGRAFTRAIGRLRGPARIGAPERHERLMDEVRTWRRSRK